MPFVHVRSLPVDAFDAQTAVAAIRSVLASDTGIDEEHVVVSWQTLDAVAGSPAVVVDVFAPDLHPPERVEVMLESVVTSVADAAGVRVGDVMANFRAARSGEVIDGGDVVRW